MNPVLKFKPNVAVPPPPPAYETAGAAGLDIRCVKDFAIAMDEYAVVDTGYDVEVPAGYVLDVRSRSGLAAKRGVFVLNSPGTIDEDYRGPLKVILMNQGNEHAFFDANDRIAQLVLLPVVHATVEVVNDLSKTDRGTGGFGSTGTA